jgi:Cu2+-exporting ATPase
MRVRLGRADWVAEIAAGAELVEGAAFAIEGSGLRRFSFNETLRPGACEAVAELARRGIAAEILSGDAGGPVRRIARAVGLERATARCAPAEKVARLEALRSEGARALMVGDGLNDAAALGAAHVSIAPASASEVGRQAADFVFTRESLAAVPAAHAIALKAARLVRQNFGLAVLYNAMAIPLAVAGYVTPLVAALAMSGSSILVVANALRLLGTERRPRDRAPAPPAAVPA